MSIFIFYLTLSKNINFKHISLLNLDTSTVRVTFQPENRKPKKFTFLIRWDQYRGEDISRKARINAPDALHHIMARGIERIEIYFAFVDPVGY